MRFHRLYLIIGLREKLTFVFIKKKSYNLLPKEIVFSKKIDAWQNNFYGNVDRECLTDYLCSRFFEENDYDEVVFDYFCRQCFCHALKVVSYLLYKSF